MMPFPEGLKEFCRKNQNFSKALKIIHPDKFIALQATATSYSPYYPEDEIIGFYVYDYGKNNPVFKQDFLLNIDKKNNNFILYTGLSAVIDNKSVKHINDFLSTYGKGGYFKDSHRITLEELPEELKDRALKAIALAEARKKGGYPKITQEHVEDIYKKFKNHISKSDPSTQI